MIQGQHIHHLQMVQMVMYIENHIRILHNYHIDHIQKLNHKYIEQLILDLDHQHNNHIGNHCYQTIHQM